MGTPTLKTESGFTFLEVMIAFSIVALVLVAIFQLHTQNIAMGVRTHFNSVAPMLADMKAVELISSPDTLSPSDNGDFGEDYIGYVWQSEVSDVDSDYLQETARRLKQFDIYVETQESSLSYHLRTYFLFDKEP